MKMQNKLAVVLAAAALLALGATSAFAAGWVQDGAEWRYVDNSGDYVTDTMKKSGTTTFYLDENGYMAKDYFLDDESTYYFGSNGAMVTNTWVAIDPSLVDNSNEGQDVCWFYFQSTGKAVKASSGYKKQAIDGKTYCFDENGIMLTGWINESGEALDAEDNDDWITDGLFYAGADGVLRQGWLAWTNGTVDSDDNTIGLTEYGDKEVMYFYFGTNFKKVGNEGQNKEKTINGKKYRFEGQTGIMFSGWEYMEDMYGADDEITIGTSSNNKYYSGEDDGHMVKKGWIYAVPSKLIDADDYDDDEEEYFYAENSGSIVRNKQKRINGKYYVFNEKGIMETGLVILTANKEYKDTIDTDETNGYELIKMGRYYNDDRSTTAYETLNLPMSSADTYTIHYYGDDGAKVTGNKIVIEFCDDTFVFASKNKGGNVTETKDKFYSNGFLCKATDDIRLAMVLPDGDSGIRTKLDLEDIYMVSNTVADYTWTTGVETDDTSDNMPIGDYYTTGYSDATIDPTAPTGRVHVVNTSGTVKKKGKYKDADGYYWLVNNGKFLVGIFDNEVKWDKDHKPVWKSDFHKKLIYSTADVGDVDEDKFYSFKYKDTTGAFIGSKLVTSINNDYCTNFTVVDPE